MKSENQKLDSIVDSISVKTIKSLIKAKEDFFESAHCGVMGPGIYLNKVIEFRQKIYSIIVELDVIPDADVGASFWSLLAWFDALSNLDFLKEYPYPVNCLTIMLIKTFDIFTAHLGILLNVEDLHKVMQGNPDALLYRAYL
jgi:hypothetical protein